jgi:hypothetical protein
MVVTGNEISVSQQITVRTLPESTNWTPLHRAARHPPLLTVSTIAVVLTVELAWLLLVSFLAWSWL